ncbi:MAG: elongation factor G [Lachnospiraceae bacterium]|nr:elongation factor G [Cuneatibacter sp.]MDD6455681.1 elongation factor G [Lachnospiraceae bacterium]
MKVYDTSRIRNVVVLGHGGAGKTTMVEAAAFVTGVTNRQGRVEDGNTISDFDKEEAKRLFSIGTSVVPIEYEDIKINFLDTPGYFDFAGEVEEALSAADAAVIVVDGKAGVQVGTERAWEYCEKHELPRMIFVTGMDDDQVSFRKVNVALNEKFGRKIAPFHIPMRENEKFVGFVNVVKMKGRRFIDGSKYEECEIPDYLEKHLAASRESLIEAVAETSEELMDRYFAGDEFTYEEVSGALRENVMTGGIVPVLMGSGVNAQGLNMLMLAIKKYFPSPDHTVLHGKDITTGELLSLSYDVDKHVSVKVFKTLVDPFIGKYSLIKVCTGTLKGDTTLYDIDQDSEEKVGKVYVLRGKEAIEVPELQAGDIGALAKMSKVQTGDTLAGKGATVVYDKPQIPTPYTYKRYDPVNKGDVDKVVSALTKLMEEDRTLRIVNDTENRQSLLYGLGDQQLDIVVSKLENRYKAQIVLSKPAFAFRETVRKKATVTGTHKKQSGGHGQYGVVVMEFENSGDLDTPYVFEERVVGGAVPKNFFPAIEKGIQESVQRGPLAGYPVVGLKATLIDGKYHPVDSSEMAFKTAASLAFKQGVMEAQPVLLEPIATVEVIVPNRFSGDVMGDMNKRRGRILGMDHLDGGKQKVTAEVPMSELYGYSTDLRSMTGGIGDFSYEFTRYEQAPADVQKKEIEARAVKEA